MIFKGEQETLREFYFSEGVLETPFGRGMKVDQKESRLFIPKSGRKSTFHPRMREEKLIMVIVTIVNWLRMELKSKLNLCT